MYFYAKSRITFKTLEYEMTEHKLPSKIRGPNEKDIEISTRNSAIPNHH